jgi:MoaA/NifB/PqqE/SkfB family radical SAM enzyme
MYSRRIEIELTTKCTIACPACPRTNQDKRKFQWDTGHLDFDVLKSIVGSTNFENYSFCGCYGDCIYHPKFKEIAEFMLLTGKQFSFETNGSHRTVGWWESISALDWDRRRSSIRFSIDGLSDTNHIYRKNSDWDSIMAGILTLGKLPYNRRPHLEWKFLVFPFNEHQVAEAETLSKQLNFDKFIPVKSTRTYSPQWFKNLEEQKLYDWTI